MPSQSSDANTAALEAYSTAQAAFGKSRATGIQLATSTTMTIAGPDASIARTPLVLSEEAYRLNVATAAIAAAGGQASRTGSGPDANSA